MERARATWTDERLDDLSRRVENGFTRVDQDIRYLGARIDSLEARFDARFDSLQHLMIQLGAGTLLAILATLVSVLLTRA